MSSATAEIFDKGGQRVGWGVYSGTSDVLDPNIASDPDAAWDYAKNFGRRRDQRNAWDVASRCSHTDEEGWAYSDYGGGFHWPTHFCRECMVVTGELCPWGQDYGWSLPSPEQVAEQKAWHEAGWPHDGYPAVVSAHETAHGGADASS